MKHRKRLLALMMALVLLVSVIPTSVLAADNDGKNVGKRLDTQVEAVEIENLGIDAEVEQSDMQEAEIRYEDDELVTIVVAVAADAVMDKYPDSSYAEEAESIGAGEAVSEFLASDEAIVTAERIIEDQQDIVDAILELVPDAEIENQWATVTNALTVTVPYGKLKEINNIPGVKNAYVEHVYDEPVLNETNVQDGKETWSYSYDMAGIGSSWEQGYTGKGMVVAVLDTGIDILWGPTDGTGLMYGIRSQHEAFTENSFKSADPEEFVRWNYDSIRERVQSTENQLSAATGNEGKLVIWDNNGLYKNLKVPFAADYADGDINPRHSSNDHGTHVSGTIAGYAKTEEGVVTMSGIAPDAQILSMKVFSDASSGAPEGAIVNALEDSLKLGADVINLSLGSDNGFAYDDTLQNGIFAKVEAAGIVMMTSAGNSAESDAYNNYYSETLTSNPDTAMMSAPAIYSSNLSVASIDNYVNVQSYFTWVDSEGVTHKAPFSDPNSVAMKYKFANGSEYPIYLVGGTGTYNDYYNAGFNNGWNGGKTGIALVKRGEITFVDKINNATSFHSTNSRGEELGVLAVIIYDSDPEGETLINMNVEGTSLTSAFISGKSGAEIVAAIESGYEVKITVEKLDETIDNETAGEMSSFSSWGAGPGLELKPEITAPGGNVWSAVYDTTDDTDSDYVGSYAMNSGTSMSAPHMAGAGLLVHERVNALGVSSTDAADVVSQLLVSTAVPQKDGNAYYSPRQQGAGLVNISAALNTPAYLSIDGQNVAKLELLDDPDYTGRYNIDFTVNNISEEDLTYDVEIVLMRPKTEDIESYWGTRTIMSNHDTILHTENLGSVTVKAGEQTDFSAVARLNTEEKVLLKGLYENGTYVEGFVILTESTGTHPTLGMAMLSFFGDWTAAPIFDAAWWIDPVEMDGETVYDQEYTVYDLEGTFGTSSLGSRVYQNGYPIGVFNLGENLMERSIVQPYYQVENLTLSPNGDLYFDQLDDYTLYQLRDAKLIVLEAKDADTGELYFRDWESYYSKSVYQDNYGYVLPLTVAYGLPIWDGTDLDGNVLPDGTNVTFTITAYGDGDYGETIYDGELERNVTDFDKVANGDIVPTFNGHAMDMTGDTISVPIKIDTSAPKLENNAVSVVEREAEDGTIHTYITGTAKDETGTLAGVAVYPYVARSYAQGYGDPSYREVSIDMTNPFMFDAIFDEATNTYYFEADVTEYTHIDSYEGESRYYNFEWTGSVILDVIDYGGNERTYAITVDTDPGIVLSQTSAMLWVDLDEDGNRLDGSEFELSVIDNTEDAEGEITRTSSNPEVATVDEFGTVTAMAPGQTIITVAKGNSYAICVVSVEQLNREVTDFKLSLDKFEGLKPGAQFTVNVVDLQPADVELESIQWLVYESEEYAESWAEGLVTVQRNTSDGLSGSVTMNRTVDEDLPAGEGILEVILNGVSRTMTFTWEDLYRSSTQDDLISDLYYEEQAVYVDLGDTATLRAVYRQKNQHAVSDILVDLAGVDLIGPDYFFVNSDSYSGKLQAKEGYSLPETIQAFMVYSGGYEYEIQDYYWKKNINYNSETGEFEILQVPTGSDTKLKIKAVGVANEGTEGDAPEGTIIAIDSEGNPIEKPVSAYGPFNWEITEGVGAGTKVESVNPFEYTPEEPGVSYITATTQDGTYSVRFAVICTGEKADEINLVEDERLNGHDITLRVGDTIDPSELVELNPEPTDDSDKVLRWTSYDKDVVVVDGGSVEGMISRGEDATLTAVGAGDVLVLVEVAKNNNVYNYIRIHVDEIPVNTYTVKFVDWDDTLIEEQSVIEGNSAVKPADPEREGYIFKGWDKEFGNITSDLTVKAEYEVAPPNEYIVKFIDWDDSVIKEQTVIEGESAEKPADPEREGYIFKGWDKEFDNITSDIVVKAVYEKEPLKEFIVVFVDWNDVLIQAQIVVEGSNATTPAEPEREGYIFKGWDKEFSNVKSDLTIKAEYEKEPTVDVTGLELIEESIEVAIGLEAKLTVNVSPENASDKTVTWTSSNEKVATVDENGVVSVLTYGTATITATTADGKYSDSCFVQARFSDVIKTTAEDGTVSYGDASGAGAYDAIYWAADNNISRGYADGTFAPTKDVSRQETVIFLYRLAGQPKVDTSKAIEFADADQISNNTARKAIQWAVQNGIAKGYSDGTFKPTASVTRQEFAIFVYRFARLQGRKDTNAGKTTTFIDEADISSKGGKVAIAWAVKEGIIKGYTSGENKGKFLPNAQSQRQQVVIMLMRYAKN